MPRLKKKKPSVPPASASPPRERNVRLNNAAVKSAKVKESVNVEKGSIKVLAINPGKLANTDEFFSLQRQSGFTANELAQLVGTTDRTIRTKKQSGDSLDIAQTERLRKLRALFNEGELVLGSVEAFAQWMNKPAYGLEYAVPFELLNQPGGADLIMSELQAIKYGDAL